MSLRTIKQEADLKKDYRIFALALLIFLLFLLFHVHITIHGPPEKKRGMTSWGHFPCGVSEVEKRLFFTSRKEENEAETHLARRLKVATQGERARHARTILGLVNVILEFIKN